MVPATQMQITDFAAFWEKEMKSMFSAVVRSFCHAAAVMRNIL